MKNYRKYYGAILENLNRAEALPELNPTERGRYVYLKCPQCQKNTAWVSQAGVNIYCNRKNNCGYVVDLITYISQRDGISEDSVYIELAKLSNTQLPELSEEEKAEIKSQRERESLYNEIHKLARVNIWGTNNPTLEYLKGERNYTDEEILGENFGRLPDLHKLKENLRGKGYPENLIVETLSSFKDSHSLLIPIYSVIGTIDGFISRAITNIDNKYLYPKNYKVGENFFNINRAKRSQTLIIVEGILDALILTEKGIEGVVACGGDSPTKEQIENALKYSKIKEIILSLDSDPAGKKGTEKAITLLREKDVRIFVAQTPDPYKDPDELVRAKGIEEYKEVLKTAQSWEKWTANKIINSNDITTDIGRERALSDLLELENSILDSTKSGNITNFISENLGYSQEVLQDKILSYHEKRSEEKQKEEYNQLIKGAQGLIKEGKYTELGDYLTGGLYKAKSLILNEIVSPYSIETAINDIKKRREGLGTGYPSLDKYITIPNGAISIVAGRPSHGKTTVLLNLLLNMVELNPEKSFYFFSYEESKLALFVKLITILSQTIINNDYYYKNSQEIEGYIKSGSQDINSIENAKEKYNQYEKAGRLWLIDNPLDVETLAGTLDNLSYKYNIGGVFIDYAQRVKFNGKYESERVKIARISETLRETATRLDIPLIVGAQLNRENAERRPLLDNLKEAGNLEEDANIVLGLYNHKTAKEKEKNKEFEDKYIDPRAIPIEVSVLKNRNGSINETAKLIFDAPILNIKDSESKNITKNNNEYDPF